MPRITLRVTDEMYHTINEIAKDQEDSLSTIAKQLIQQGLSILKHPVETTPKSANRKDSLELIYLLKKLMYEHFEYTQADFDKVNHAVKRKLESVSL